ncbi:hypothetical protein J7E88_07845 [Streptomyces sp. ISL-10]|uniref:hypothetical protein n=1 Tax=Streptomyces sp. ISL-10 TaxID=2819172 RepID=UPI001BE849DD|nr:hypothetical protein [Streptomyces sp. ISL-10]MBT2365234.1 hypothetical protein [Streptomyces sp. ISL-10]
MINKQSGPRTESDDRTHTVTITWGEYAALLEAKAQVDRVKAALSEPVQVVAPVLPDAADYFLDNHPDLIDYSGLSAAQAALIYPELFEYELPERDC